MVSPGELDILNNIKIFHTIEAVNPLFFLSMVEIELIDKIIESDILMGRVRQMCVRTRN